MDMVILLSQNVIYQGTINTYDNSACTWYVTEPNIIKMSEAYAKLNEMEKFWELENFNKPIPKWYQIYIQSRM